MSSLNWMVKSRSNSHPPSPTPFPREKTFMLMLDTLTGVVHLIHHAHLSTEVVPGPEADSDTATTKAPCSSETPATLCTRHEGGSGSPTRVNLGRPRFQSASHSSTRLAPG